MISPGLNVDAILHDLNKTEHLQFKICHKIVHVLYAYALVRKRN